MKTESPQNSFCPGDKVVCTDSKFLRSAALLFNHTPRQGQVYSIRGLLPDGDGNPPGLHLAGIFGYPEEGRDYEPSFRASRFKRVSKENPCMPVELDEIVKVPVPVSSSIVSRLHAFPLFPQVEHFNAWESEANFQAACRRWTGTWHQSKSISAMHEAIVAEITASGPHTVIVPLSGLGVSNLLRVVDHLGVPMEAWLQGVLGNLAARCETSRKFSAMAARKEARQRRRG